MADKDGVHGDAWGAVGVKRMIAQGPGIKRPMPGDESNSGEADDWGGNLPRHAKGGRIQDDEDGEGEETDEMCEGGRPKRKKGGKAEGRMEERRLDRRPRKAGGGSFRTPSGGVSVEGRHKAEAKGETMPGGGFPIRNASDLANAKHDVGRAKNPAAARRWINKRARELDEPALGGSKY